MPPSGLRVAVRALGALALLAASARAAIAADEVKSLPGWTGPLPSRTYSGHIASGWDVQDGVNRTMMMWCVVSLAALEGRKRARCGCYGVE